MWHRQKKGWKGRLETDKPWDKSAIYRVSSWGNVWNQHACYLTPSDKLHTRPLRLQTAKYDRKRYKDGLQNRAKQHHLKQLQRCRKQATYEQMNETHQVAALTCQVKQKQTDKKKRYIKPKSKHEIFIRKYKSKNIIRLMSTGYPSLLSTFVT